MANINPILGTKNTIQNRPDVREIAQPVRVQRAGAEDTAAKKPGAKPVDEEPVKQLEDVIAVSKDGDTLQASEEAVRELQDDEENGRVIEDPNNKNVKAEEKNETRQELLTMELERSAQIREAMLEEAQKEAAARREEALQEEPNAVLAEEKATSEDRGQVSSFIGYSDAELERMYLQGDISKFDYDKEMETRTEQEEARREQLTDFALDSTKNVSELERSERQGEEIERAFSDTANERLDVENRAQLIMALQNSNAQSATATDDDVNRAIPLTNFSLS